ncbi:MAG: signal peptide peptidase SppA [Deltaproteobacteria bacterium]|nr:signal peptide peptidase SppA [Deltaproteobacteria bacterium]MBF0523593.1 signal peptide peptidase SppA [Deltaproteobacteria bacterium]
MKKHPIILGLAVAFTVAAFALAGMAATGLLFKGNAGISLSDKIAVVVIKGVMLESRKTIEDIEKYRKDRTVKAIIIRIDSPGGAVGPAQEIYEAIKSAKASKKIVASLSNVAASGGYYVAAPTDKIVANPATLTGSIGVIMDFANVEELLKKVGLDFITLKAGKFKDIGSVSRRMTAEEKDLLQSVLDDVHAQFIRAVAEGRKIPQDKIRAIADGRIFTGEQAKKMGLVDQLGGLADAVELAKKLSGAAADAKVVYSDQDKKSIMELFTATLANVVMDRLNLRGAAPMFISPLLSLGRE